MLAKLFWIFPDGKYHYFKLTGYPKFNKLHKTYKNNIFRHLKPKIVVLVFIYKNCLTNHIEQETNNQAWVKILTFITGHVNIFFIFFFPLCIGLESDLEISACANLPCTYINTFNRIYKKVKLNKNTLL